MEKIKILIDSKEEEIITKLDENYIERNNNLSFEDTINLTNIIVFCGNND